MNLINFPTLLLVYLHKSHDCKILSLGSFKTSNFCLNYRQSCRKRAQTFFYKIRLNLNSVVSENAVACPTSRKQNRFRNASTENDKSAKWRFVVYIRTVTVRFVCRLLSSKRLKGWKVSFNLNCNRHEAMILLVVGGCISMPSAVTASAS